MDLSMEISSIVEVRGDYTVTQVNQSVYLGALWAGVSDDFRGDPSRTQRRDRRERCRHQPDRL